LEDGISKREDATVGRNEVVPTSVRGGGDPDDWFVWHGRQATEGVSVTTRHNQSLVVGNPVPTVINGRGHTNYRAARKDSVAR